MFADIVSLQNFYQTALGQRTQRLLNLRLAALWPNLRGDVVLTLGYGAPLLQNLARHPTSVLAFMPAGQGVAPCPVSGPNISCLVDFDQLPLPDNCIDRVIMLHALEGASDPETTLGEIWRAMKGNARLLIIVPNRMGLWAHSDRTPFGNGQPYSAAQIKTLLQNQGFCVEHMTHALYAPPSHARFFLSGAERIEKYAARFFPAFGGVLMIEASKHMHAPKFVKSGAQRLAFPLPFPTAPLLPT